MSTILNKLNNNLMYASFSIIYVANEEFVDWLNAEMQERGWSVRETARRADLSPTLISNINNGDQPSFDTCVALADVFNKPRTDVVVLAGLLPPPQAHDPEVEELMHLFRQMKDQDRQEMIEIAQLKLKRLKDDSEGAERVKRGDSKAK